MLTYSMNHWLHFLKSHRFKIITLDLFIHTNKAIFSRKILLLCIISRFTTDETNFKHNLCFQTGSLKWSGIRYGSRRCLQ